MAKLIGLQPGQIYINNGLLDPDTKLPIEWQLYKPDSGSVYLISSQNRVYWGKLFQFNQWTKSDLRKYLNETVYNGFQDRGKQCLLPQTNSIRTDRDGGRETVIDNITITKLDVMSDEIYYHQPISNYQARMVIKLDGNRNIFNSNGKFYDTDVLKPIRTRTYINNDDLGTIYNRPFRIFITLDSVPETTYTAKLFNYNNGVRYPETPLQEITTPSTGQNLYFDISAVDNLPYMEQGFLRVEITDKFGRVFNHDIKYINNKYTNGMGPTWNGYDSYVGSGSSRKFLSNHSFALTTSSTKKQVFGTINGKQFSPKQLSSSVYNLEIPLELWDSLPSGDHIITLTAVTEDGMFTQNRYSHLTKINTTLAIGTYVPEFVIKNTDFRFSMMTNNEEHQLRYKIYLNSTLSVDTVCTGSYDHYFRLSDSDWNMLPLGRHVFDIELTNTNTGQVVTKTIAFEKLSDRLAVRKTVKAKKGTAKIVVIYNSNGITTTECKLIGTTTRDCKLIESINDGQLTTLRYSCVIDENISDIDWLVTINKEQLNQTVSLIAVSFAVF